MAVLKYPLGLVLIYVPTHTLQAEVVNTLSATRLYIGRCASSASHAQCSSFLSSLSRAISQTSRIQLIHMLGLAGWLSSTPARSRTPQLGSTGRKRFSAPRIVICHSLDGLVALNHRAPNFFLFPSEM